MTMFFPRLRKQAKWVFVFLAVVFMLSFVFLGVGSGSTGIADLLNPSQWFSGSGGPSTGSLAKKAREHPLDSQAALNYAQALDTAGKSAQAVAVLEAFLKRRPHNVDVLSDLSGRYETQASNALTQAQNAQANSDSISGSSLVPSLTGKGGVPALGTDPIVSAVSTQSQDTVTKAQTQAQTALNNDVRVLKALVAATPDDTTQVFRLAQAADAAGDSQTAMTYYKRFIKAAPDDPQAALAKTRLKQLQHPQVSPTVTPSTGG
jgi:tetratricopeptide (TPR) repeat protein